VIHRRTLSAIPSQVIEAFAREAERAFARDGRVLFVLGQPGSGITTALRAFAIRMDRARPRVQVAFGSCNGTRGSVWREILRRLTRRQRALGSLRRLTVAWLGLIPILGKVITAAVETAAVVGRSFARNRFKLRSRLAAAEAVRQILDQQKQARQLVCIDHAELATAEDITALSVFLRGLPKTRTLLLIGITAPRRQLPGPLHDLLLEVERTGSGGALEMPPLGAELIAATAVNRFRADVPALWVEWLARESGGNPARLVRALGLLRERGYVTGSGRRAKWVDHPPLTLQLDGVSEQGSEAGLLENDRVLLTCAAVTGTVFHGAVLAELLGRPELSVEDDFARLARAGLIVCVPRYPEEPELTSSYTIRDTRVHERLLAECPPALRAEYDTRARQIEQRLELAGKP
jgi:hypothetical protein